MRQRSTRPAAARKDLPGLLATLARTMDGRIQSRLHRLGYGDVRPGHLALILQLDRGAARGSDLARRSGMTKQSMAELVRELELADYVERRPDPRDGRARLIQPTGRGLMLIAHTRQAVAEIEGEVAGRLGRDRFVALQRALVELVAPAQATTPGQLVGVGPGPGPGVATTPGPASGAASEQLAGVSPGISRPRS